MAQRCYKCGSEILFYPCPTCERNRLLEENNRLIQDQINQQKEQARDARVMQEQLASQRQHQNALDAAFQSLPAEPVADAERQLYAQAFHQIHSEKEALDRQVQDLVAEKQQKKTSRDEFILGISITIGFSVALWVMWHERIVSTFTWIVSLFS